ncbi:hypothetical protein HA402_000859 [Bradysia odoriphaga]|nr:hypothetical protein HA402_000859 [Bradysia odoriphaga]
MILLLILVIVLILVIRFWYKDHYRYWTKRGFVSDVACFPLDTLTGTGTSKTNAELFDELYYRFKGHPAAGLFFVFKPAIAIYDPELIQAVLVKDFAYFHDRSIYYNEADDPLSAHLAAIDGQKWKERRSKLTHAFTTSKMKMMFDIIENIGDRFTSAIKKDLQSTNDVQISEWSARFTTDVIGNIAFGVDYNCIENPETEIRKHGKNFFRIDTPVRAMKMLFTNSFPNLSRRMGLMMNPKDSADFFLKVFNETIKYREKSKVDRNDFIKIVLQIKESSSLTFNEMAAESFVFFFGGFHTTASVLNFILYELALHHEIQTKLRQEIDEVLNKGKLLYESTTEMKYLDSVVNEGLRKYPPLHLFIRRCVKDYKIPNTNLIIPRGTQCTIPVYSIHHDNEYYPQPDVFDPERFNSQNAAKIKPFTFLPFGTILGLVIILR